MMRWWPISRRYVTDRNVKIEEADWTKDLDFIRAMMRYNIDESVFDIATARQRLVTVDPQARFAISKFPEAENFRNWQRPARQAVVKQQKGSTLVLPGPDGGPACLARGETP